VGKARRLALAWEYVRCHMIEKLWEPKRPLFDSSDVKHIPTKFYQEELY